MADVPSTLQQLKEQFDFEEHEVLKISAKEGLNCDQVLEAIVEQIPAPDSSKSEEEAPFRGFLFDAFFVPSRGVACLIKVMSGANFSFETLRALTSYHTGKKYDIYELGLV